MSEKRLVAISGEQVERFRDLAAASRSWVKDQTLQADADLLDSIVTAYEEGLTEEEAEELRHAADAWGVRHTDGSAVTDKLTAAFNQEGAG